jgi:hypothetical protein
MANRYWVGGTGNWNDTAKWAATSGGTGGETVPTAADNAYFDGSSDSGAAFTVTVNAASVCNDLIIGDVTTVTALDQVMTLAGSSGLTIFGSLFFPATNLTRTYTGYFVFAATTTGKTVTTNGVAFSTGSTVNFQGIGGSWTLGSAFLGSPVLTVLAGTFTTNNYSVQSFRFQIQGTDTKVINLGSSLVTVNPSNFEGYYVFGGASTANTTLNAGTSTIRLGNLGQQYLQFYGGNFTYYNVEFMPAAIGQIHLLGTNTFNNLTFASRSATGIGYLNLGANQTINGTLDIQSANTDNQRRFIVTQFVSAYLNTTPFTPKTITAAAIAIGVGVDFQYVTAAGASAPWNLSALGAGNGGNNSNITFPTPKTVYWNLAGAQNWNATAWATTRNGTPADANFPLAQDTAVITELGLANTITVNNGFYLGTLTFDDGVSPRTSGVTFTNTAGLNILGDVKLSTGVFYAGGGSLNFVNSTNQNITTAGKTITSPIQIDSSGAGLTLQDTFTNTNLFTLTRGYLTLNGYILTCLRFITSQNTGSGAGPITSINFGTSKIIVTGNNAVVIEANDTRAFTYTGTPRFECSYAGATGSRGITWGRGISGAAVFSNISVYITAGTDNVYLDDSNSNNSAYITVDFTGFSGSASFIAIRKLYGDLVLSPTMTFSNTTGAISFQPLVGQVSRLTTNGTQFPVTLNAEGSGTTILQSNVTFAATKTLTNNSGTFDLNGKVVTTAAYTSTGGSLIFGAAQLIITGSGTCFSKSAGTITPGNGKIVLNDNTSTARTFAGGNILTYPELEIGGDTGTSVTTITGANRFAKLTNTKTVAYTIVFPNAITAVTEWNLNGSAGNLITLSRTGGSGTFTINYAGGQYIVARYLSISNSAATPANRVYAIYSVDNGNNTGWKFDAPKFGSFLSFFSPPL